MKKATPALAANHARGPSNPEKTLELEDGGGNHQTRKNVVYTSTNEGEISEVCHSPMATDW